MKLLCAGEAFEDLVFFALARLPELGEEVKTDSFTATVGGGAVITAVHAARLGMKSAILSALGDAAVAHLKRERVSVTNLRRPNEPHAITAALSTEEDRAFVTFNGVNAKLEARIATTLSKATADHIHFCFYPHDCAQWTRIVTRLRKRGITTSWDFGWNEPLTGDRGLTDLIDALDFVFVNEVEARLYTGEATLEAAIPHWRERQAITIIKQGDRGATWIAPDRDIHFPAPRVKVVDAAGASDVFNAGFLVAWMRGQSPAQCLAAGSKTASSRHPAP
ncbi:MAG: carbohydrate kinase family protein [Acidobacteriota bacterium]|nr:carbohydrate kinase family protein [Acidobacteriota bacterium]